MKLITILTVFILLISIVSCGEYVLPEPSSFEQASEDNEQNVKNLIENDVIPKVSVSLERENIKKRVEFINQPDRIGYLYILSSTGQLIMEVQVLGKTSSLNSYLTPMEDVQWYEKDVGESWGEVPIITQAPDLDGTYGENATGIFWFTPDGTYQELVGEFMCIYSAERMTFISPPILIENVN